MSYFKFSLMDSAVQAKGKGTADSTVKYFQPGLKTMKDDQRMRKDTVMHKATFTLALTFTLLVASFVLAGDQFTFPETRTGEVARGYIEAFNSRDVEMLKKFNTDYRSEASLAKRSVDDRATQTLGLYEQLGRLEPALITNEDEYSITITVRSEKINLNPSIIMRYS